jgi:hypothetical protein
VVICLQMENLIVEVVTSLVVLCVGNCDGPLLFLIVMGILLGGFTLFRLVGRLLTVMVTISSCICLLWGCCICFKLPFGHCVSSRSMFVGFSPSRGLMFVIWHQNSWLGGAIMTRSMSMVVGTWGLLLLFHWHFYKWVWLLRKARGLCL